MGAALSETSTDNTSASSAEGEAEQLPVAATQGAESDTDGVDYKALYESEKAGHEKWRSISRKHEERAKANAEAASKAKTVEEQLEELRKELADNKSAAVAKSGRLAVSQVQAKLAASGYAPDDVAGLLTLIDPSGLLKNGEPDSEAIDNLAKSLIKVGGRTTPDPDQGHRGGKTTDMNALLRKAAGR